MRFVRETHSSLFENKHSSVVYSNQQSVVSVYDYIMLSFSSEKIINDNDTKVMFKQ